MDNFKFNFLSRGQLESLILDEFLLTGFKTITCHKVFSGNLIFAIIARMLCGNHLKCRQVKTEMYWPTGHVDILFFSGPANMVSLLYTADLY